MMSLDWASFTLGVCFLLGSALLRLLGWMELTGYMNYYIVCSSFYQSKHDKTLYECYLHLACVFSTFWRHRHQTLGLPKFHHRGPCSRILHRQRWSHHLFFRLGGVHTPQGWSPRRHCVLLPPRIKQRKSAKAHHNLTLTGKGSI